ncbi:MAG TPA: hypothetical protein VF034_00805 [Gemmatimonadaceae bacterium]
MKTVMRCLLVTALLLSGSRAVTAQTITFTNGSGGTFTIASAVAGQDPASVSNGAGNFTTSTKKSDGILRIRAQLDQAMPANTTLTLTVTYPAGTTLGPQVLGITPVDLVVNIPSASTTRTGTVSYSFTATASAGVLAPFTRNVTLTIGP